MKIDLSKVNFPREFYASVLEGINPELFFESTSEYPELQSTIFEGFSLSRKKMKRIMSQGEIKSRIRNLARHSSRFLDFLIRLWGKEHKETIQFFRCLNPEFIWENFDRFKDVFGPADFFCVLYNVEVSDEETDITRRFGEDFWERKLEVSLEFLAPLTMVSKFLVHDDDPGPEESQKESGTNAIVEESRGARKKLEKKLKKQQEAIKGLEARIEKLNKRHKKDVETIERYRQQVAECRRELEHKKSRMDEVVRREKRRVIRELFANYEDVSMEQDLDSLNVSLDSIFEQADRALRLQQEADREYGKISELRTKLMKLEQYLDEISKIYADSVLIHSEVRKVKRLLDRQKEKILSLPRSELLLSERRDSWEQQIVKKISLLEPSLKSLRKLKHIKSSVTELDDIGLDIDARYIRSAIEKREYTILRYLSEKFCAEIDPAGEIEIVEDFNKFITSNTSKSYDLYVDAYNILLSANDNRPIPEDIFREMRENFTRAIINLGPNFKHVYLVFDGRGFDKERHGNVDIIFADRFRGESADEIIIRLIRRRKDNRAVLATADREIIKQSEENVFATIEPHNFFSCLYDYGFNMFCLQEKDSHFGE